MYPVCAVSPKVFPGSVLHTRPDAGGVVAAVAVGAEAIHARLPASRVVTASSTRPGRRWLVVIG